MTAQNDSQNKPYTPRLSLTLLRWRWQIPLALFVLVLVHQIAEHTVLQGLPRSQHFASQLIFYGITGPVLAWWAVNSLYHSTQEIEHTQHDLEEAHLRVSRANQQLALLIEVNRRLADAQDEDELLEIILNLPRAVIPALGASLIQFDENQRCTASSYGGDLDQTAVTSWASQLKDSELRRSCQHCTVQYAHPGGTCPILNRSSEYLPAAKAYCFPFKRGEREFAVLNIYLPADYALSQNEKELLAAMVDEMSLALESHQFRTREMQTLYRMRKAKTTASLQATLVDMLDEIVAALEIDGGLLYLSESNTAPPRLFAESGQSIGRNVQIVQGLVLGTTEDDDPVVIGEISQGHGGANMGSLMVAPMKADNVHAGAFVLWDRRPEIFARRHVRLIAALASQAGMLIDHNRLYASLEHKAALAERARLAREIHDGLAQTLGFLKLRTLQVEEWLHKGEQQRASAALHQMEELAASAYVDAREAIDGLRIQPVPGDLSGWLTEVLDDFRALCDIEIESEPPPLVRLPAEVHAQLMRITQEALGNVRKHSHATRVSLMWELDDEGLTLRILDDGQGFNLDEVPVLSRHGLRIMQERAEMMAAHIEIDSRPSHGAQVTLRLPAYSIQPVLAS